MAGNQNANVDISVGAAAHAIYALFYNKRFGLGIILAAGLASLIGVIFPQAPAGLHSDPQAMSSWLDSVRADYGGWTDILAAIGVFHMFSSVPFLIIMAGLALSILACTTHRIPLLYKAAFNPRTKVKPAFFTRVRHQASFATDSDDISAAIESVAKRRSMRLIENDNSSYYLDRFHWAPLGTAVAHLAFIVIMIGFLVSSFAGFKDEHFALTVDIPHEVGHNSGLVAKANSFTDSYYPDGTPKDYVTDLSILKYGQEVARQDVRVNEPLKYDGVMFHQAYFGVSAVVNVRDKDGAEVFANGVPLDYTTADKTRSYGVVELPESGQELFIIAPASGQTIADIAAGQIRVELYPDDSQDLIAYGVLDPGQSAKLDGLSVEFNRESQFTGLLVKKDPGTGIVWLGSALLMIGMCATMFFPRRRIWVRLVKDGSNLVQLASIDRAEVGFERDFQAFSAELEEELKSPTVIPEETG